MMKRAKERAARRGKRKGILLLAKVVIYLTIFANMGLLAWYLSGHQITLRSGARTQPLVANPDQLDFGQAEPGSPLTRTVMIRNRTRGDVEIEAIDMTHDSFRLKTQPGDLRLAARAEVEVIVVYVPRIGGVNEGEMLVHLRGDDAEPLRVPLRGETMLPRLAVSTSALNFGEVASGEGARLPLKVANKGNRPLRVETITVRGDGFGLVEPFAPTTIAPGKALTVKVAFVPARIGASEGELVVTANDPNNAESTVRLAGSFGTAAQQARNKAQALALLNDAKRDLNSAFAYLSFQSTDKLLMRDRHRMGQELFEKAWPNYERANAMLRSIDPSREDREFYVDDSGTLQRRQ
jgi:hypothetical protein